jgi:hypothetical protein
VNYLTFFDNAVARRFLKVRLGLFVRNTGALIIQSLLHLCPEACIAFLGTQSLRHAPIYPRDQLGSALCNGVLLALR